MLKFALYRSHGRTPIYLMCQGEIKVSYCGNMDLQVANGTAFLYDGWIEVAFQLLGEYGQSEPITVPI